MITIIIINTNIRHLNVIIFNQQHQVIVGDLIGTVVNLVVIEMKIIIRLNRIINSNMANGKSC